MSVKCPQCGAAAESDGDLTAPDGSKMQVFLCGFCAETWRVGEETIETRFKFAVDRHGNVVTTEF